MQHKVREPLKHNGKSYGDGDVIELDAETAKPLLDSGVVEAGGKAAPAGPKAPADEAERLSAIKDAIGQMDKSDIKLWLKSGSPDLEAVSAITGWPVTAADRNQVWEALKG